MHVTLGTEVQAALVVLRITDGMDPRVLHVYSAVQNWPARPQGRYSLVHARPGTPGHHARIVHRIIHGMVPRVSHVQQVTTP